MDEKALSMTIFTLLGLLAAFTYSFFDPTLILLGSEIKLPIIIFTILNFFFGTIFFGYLAFLPAILMGLNLGAQKNAAIFLYIIPIVISTYAGTKLGFGIEKDFWKKDNYLPTIKKIFGILFIAIIIAIIIELALPHLIQFWPKGTGELGLEQGETIIDLIQGLEKYKR
ncbi:MAG: hypothetical protein BWY55_00640 [archaeon ADurb.Bin336]|nr:MAG: hypothetical protein BWY55_00640 [archaeon ADurb.Bin336]